MRTIIDLPDDLRTELDRVRQEDDISRAELIRRALAAYLRQRARMEPEAVFGLWKERSEEGLAYQDRLRDVQSPCDAITVSVCQMR